MIVITGTATVQEDRREEARAAAVEMARLSRGEKGCGLYEISQTLEDPCTFRIVEQWDSQPDLDAHFRTAHFADFNGRLSSLLAGPPSFTRYEVSSSGNLF